MSARSRRYARFSDQHYHRRRFQSHRRLAIDKKSSLKLSSTESDRTYIIKVCVISSEDGSVFPSDSTGWTDDVWEDLLAYIEEQRVIPIVGPDLLRVRVGDTECALYVWLAQRLAERLGLASDALSAASSLNNVVCEFLKRRGRREDVYPKLRAILRNTQFTLPESLLQLAGMTDFNLYITITFDSLLEQAINEVRHQGEACTEVLAYAPNRVVDLPCEKERLPRVTIYHLLGRVSASPSYAVSDEDVLEFVCALQSENFCPEKLFSELENNHLLVLGCGFPDWLERFFLRMAKRHRLSDPRDYVEIVSDSSAQRDPNLVLFLQQVSSRTKVYRGADTTAFVAELWKRWSDRHIASTPVGGLQRFLPPAREMPDHAIFISYAREDLPSVKELKAGLDAAGLTTWFDMDRLEGGDDYDRKIRQNINRCAFFIPIISRAIQRRVEGYFRREWNYAVERTKGMAEGAVFILPIVIDDTPETGALVPDRMMVAHWTRLAGGRPTQEFINRLQELSATAEPGWPGYQPK